MYNIFDLYVLQNWSVKRITSQLNVTEDVVYQTKSRMLVKLKEILPHMEEIW